MQRSEDWKLDPRTWNQSGHFPLPDVPVVPSEEERTAPEMRSSQRECIFQRNRSTPRLIMPRIPICASRSFQALTLSANYFGIILSDPGFNARKQRTLFTIGGTFGPFYKISMLVFFVYAFGSNQLARGNISKARSLLVSH